MPWFRLDDSFHSHPKVIAAGNEATGLYVRCGSYAAEHLTDGFIPEHVALLYGSQALADTLVRTKLWRRVKGGWRMPDFLDYNPSKERVIHTREARAESGRKGGVASGKARATSGNKRSKPEANCSEVGSHLLEPPSRSRPGLKTVDVINRTNGSRASPFTRDVIEAITEELLDRTGYLVDDDWACRVAAELLKGQPVSSPAAYVRQAIRNDPDPRKRFLPLY